MSSNFQDELVLSAVATGLSYAVGYTSKSMIIQDVAENVGANVAGSYLGSYLGTSLNGLTNVSNGLVASGDAASAIALALYYKFVKKASVQNAAKKGGYLLVSNIAGRMVVDKVLKK